MGKNRTWRWYGIKSTSTVFVKNSVKVLYNDFIAPKNIKNKFIDLAGKERSFINFKLAKWEIV